MSAKKFLVAAMLLLSATSATLAQGYSTNAARVWGGHGYHSGGGAAAPASPGSGIGSQR